MKNRVIIILIIILAIILGIIIYLYIKPSNNYNMNFEKLENMGTTVDTSNWTYEEYTFTEDIDDTLDTNNSTSIDLTEQKITGNGAKFNNGILYITSGGEYTLSGDLLGSIEIDTQNKIILNLNNVNIKSSKSAAIHIKSSKKTIINLVDGSANYLEDTNNYLDTEDEAKGTLFSNDPIKILGTGSLIVTGNYNHAIVSDDYLLVENGNITLSAITDGLHANEHIGITGGTINIIKGNDGIESEGGIIIDNGQITTSTEDDGIAANGTFIMNNGIINVKSGEEGIESKTNIIINNGNINIKVNDDGLNGTYDITINGGNLVANVTTGDGIDSNGKINITGGSVLAEGGNVPEGGIDSDNNEFIITGGILIATGGTNSTPTANSCKQNSILLGNINANETVVISDGNNEIINFILTKSAQNILVSSPKLESQKEYSLYINNTLKTTFTINSVITNVNGTTQNNMPGDKKMR